MVDGQQSIWCARREKPSATFAGEFPDYRGLNMLLRFTKMHGWAMTFMVIDLVTPGDAQLSAKLIRPME